MVKIDEITEIEIKDGILTISQFDNNKVILNQSSLNAINEAINYTHSCKSDSEQLPSFLYKSDGGLYFKHREDADVIEQWNEYLKTR